MRRAELAALRSTRLRWERLVEVLPAALESLGLVHDDASGDGQVTLQDHGEAGCVLLLDDHALARRAALALATRAGVPIDVFEVVGSSGKHNRFRTRAFAASAAGELRDAEGKELDLEDTSRSWGAGSLADQARHVLDEFATLPPGAQRTLRLGYRKRPAGRPSTPRVATLLASLQKAKAWRAAPLPDGRVELSIELAAGGRQTSFCSAAEHEELARLVGTPTK